MADPKAKGTAPTTRPGCGKPIGSTGYFKVFCGSVLGPLCPSCNRLEALPGEHA